MATTNRDTLNQIITELEAIATAHYQINSFSFGDIWEINTSGGIDYPLMHLNIDNVEIQGSVQKFKFNLLFCDIVKGGEVNENDVLSDQLEIAKDVIAQLKHKDYAWDFLGNNLVLEAFTERLTDSVSGYSLSIDLELPYDSNRCSIPTSNIVITAGGSASTGGGGSSLITVQNSNGSYSVTTSTNLTLPDTTFNVYIDGALNQSSTIVTLGNETINISL